MAASSQAGRLRYEPAAGPLRLSLAPTFGGSLDGHWWPYGRDLTREGSHLADAFPEKRGRVDRLAYCPEDWDVVEDHVFTQRGRVKVGFLPPEERRLMLVRLAGNEIVRLRVVHEVPVSPDTPIPRPDTHPTARSGG